MADKVINAPGRDAAYQPANATKTPPQCGALSAKWPARILEFQDLEKVPGLRLAGRAARKTGGLSFVPAGRGSEEPGKCPNTQGAAFRAGRHWAQPALRFFGLEGTVRSSLAFYDTLGEIDQLAETLKELAG
jgi:cysteine desulfurase/selenocysteine lyase